MVTRGSKSEECCTDSLHLPEEMEAALHQLGGMDRLKERIPSKGDLASDARTFHALSDPIRLQIMHALRIVNLCPCLLKEITELSDSKLSYHLNILERAGLIASSPRKRWRIYMLTPSGKKWIRRPR